jgi:flagellar biosynthetic protein FlhB
MQKEERKIDLQLFASYEKTEDPTPKHRREAREKGQVARSQDVMVAVSFLAAIIFFASIFPGLADKMKYFTKTTFFQRVKDVGKGGLMPFVDASLRFFISLILPLLGVPFIAVFIAGLAQVGFLFSWEPLSPKLSRLNPIEGFKRIFSKRALVEFAKALLKISIIGAIVYTTLASNASSIAALSTVSLDGSIKVLAGVLRTLGFRVGLALIGIAIADYAYQRYEYESTLKMTKDEVKEEYKQMEGDPLVRQRIRETQRRMAFQRMMGDVPDADVVVTNPDHIAVALKYESKKMNAPKVVAKGKGHIAQRIKDIARENRVPIMENKPLARSLYSQVEIGHEIPAELYKAVAQILAHVYRLKGRNF